MNKRRGSNNRWRRLSVAPILAQGAAFVGFPLMDRFDGDITALIRTGDRVEVFPKEGRVVVTR